MLQEPTCKVMSGKLPMLDTKATRQTVTVEVPDPAPDAACSFVTSTGSATVGRAAKAEATREARASWGIEAVLTPSRAKRNVPDTAFAIRTSCCSVIPLAPSHS